MSKASKRERQRQNRETRRQIEEAAEKRRKRFRTARNFGFVLLPIIVIFVILQIRQSDDDSGESKKNDDTPQRTFDAPPPMTIDPAKTYLAAIDTSEGEILVELDAASAPTSVNNFVFLARERFYDGLAFHRVARDFVIQTGSPKDDGIGGPGYSITAEVPANGYELGSVAWAKGGSEPAGTAGSQFFIVTSEAVTPGQGLDALNTEPYQYGIVGRVTGGLEVVQEIGKLYPGSGDGEPTKDVTVNKIRITESDVPSTSTVPAESTPPSS